MGNAHSANLTYIDAKLDALAITLSVTILGAVYALENVSEAEVIDAVKRLSLATGLTVAIFQTNPATGTMTDPENINDNNTGTDASADTIGKYAEVDLGAVYIFKQYRHYGTTGNSGIGRWTLQRKVADTWEDIVEIPIRATAIWSDWIEIPAATSQYVRLVCKVVDTGTGDGIIRQLELKY